MPNRFLWMVAAVGFTALGILGAPDEYVSPTIRKRRVHKAPIVETKTEPSGPKQVAAESISIPDGVNLPVHLKGDPLLPRETIRLIVVNADGSVFFSVEPPVMTTMEGVPPGPAALAPVGMRRFHDSLIDLIKGTVKEDAAKRIELVLVADAAVPFRPVIDRILRAAAAQSIEVDAIQFAVSGGEGVTGMRSMRYTFYETDEGVPTPVLPARENELEDGGVLRIDLVEGKPKFRFVGDEADAATSLFDNMLEWHNDFVETFKEGSRYADDGRRWTIRPAATAPWGAMIDGMAAIRAMGVPRVGIEWRE